MSRRAVFSARKSRVVFAGIAALGLILGVAAPASAEVVPPGDTVVVSDSGGSQNVVDAPATPTPTPTDTPVVVTPSPVETTPALEGPAEQQLRDETGAPAVPQPVETVAPRSIESAAEQPIFYSHSGEQRVLTATPGTLGTVVFTGRVADSAGAPIAGVSVVAYTPEADSGDASARATTRDDGTFSIAAGDVRWTVLTVEASEARATLAAEGSASGLVAGNAYDVGDIVIETGGAVVSGTITFPAANLDGFSTAVVLSAGRDFAASVTVTGAPGSTEAWFAVVRPGTYAVKFSDGYRFAPLWWRDAASAEGATTITVGQGDRLSGIDGVLTVGDNTVAGTVTRSSGGPSAGAYVQLESSGGGYAYYSTNTDSAGRYFFTNVAPGDYTLRVTPITGGGLPTYYGGTDDATAQRLRISDDGATTLTGIDVVVFAGAQITGQLPQAAIEHTGFLQLHGGETDWVYAHVADDGTFTFHDVRPGTYWISAHVGDVDVTVAEGVTVTGSETVTVDASALAVTDFGTLDVTVPAAGADGWSSRVVTVFDAVTKQQVAEKYVYGDSSTTFTLPAGGYFVRYDPPQGASLYYPASTAFSGAEIVEVIAGEAAVIAFAEGTASIRGTVVDAATGDPVAGLSVGLYRANALDAPIATVATDASGAYAFTGLGTDNFAVEALTGDSFYVSAWFGPSGQRDDATAIALEDGEEYTEADFALTVGGAVEGVVVGDDLDGSVDIWLEGLGVGGFWQRATVTHEDGGAVSWSLRGVAPGEYRIDAFVDGISLEGPATVLVEAGVTTSGVVLTQPAAQIVGVVTSAVTGSPVSVLVSAESADGSGGHNSTYSDATTGAYALRGLEPGADYIVKFERQYSNENLATQWWQGAPSAAEATPVTVPPVGAEAFVADAQLAAAATVNGRVIDSASGAPVAGIWVHSDHGGSDVSRSDGSFTLYVDPVDQVEITASATSTYVALTQPVTTAEAVASGVELQLTRGYTISGTVTSRNNAVPLSGIGSTVYARGAGNDVEYAGYGSTDRNGFYETEALAPGDYVLSFDNWSGLYVTQFYDGAADLDSAQVVRIVDESLTDVDVQLTLGGVIRGTVRDADGEPVAWARVGVATAPESGLASFFSGLFGGDAADAILGVEVYTDADGTFTLPALDPGDYTLYVYTGDHRTLWWNGQSTRADADVISIRAGATTVIDAEVADLGAGEQALSPEQSLSGDFAIVRQPADVTATVGSSAAFTAIASGVPVADVQWQVKRDGEWTDLVGETYDTLFFDNVSDADDESVYRAVFTQGDDTLTTRDATLRVVAEPTVAVAPSAPEVSDVTTSSATVAWSAPASDGGAAVTGYVVSVFRAGAVEPVRTVRLGATLSQTIGGLEAGTDFEVTVAAVNRVGDGVPSERTAFTTVALTSPAVPTDVSVTVTGETSAAVRWAAPETDGGSAVTGYVVTVLDAEGEPVDATVVVTAASAAITGLVADSGYQVSVAATNAVGTGDASQPVAFRTDAVAPAVTVPAAPAAPSARATGSDRVVLAWAVPADGGSAITGYAVRVFEGGVEVPALAVTATGATVEVTGLEPATEYSFSVAARNELGYGDYSALSASVATQAPAPVDPVDPVDPVNPVDPVDPVEPVDPTDPGPIVAPVPTDDNRGELSLTPANVVAGGTLTVTGLAPHTAYRVWFFSDPVDAGIHTSDADGVVTLTVPPLPGNPHRVVFTDAVSGAVVGWERFTIVPDPTTSGGGSSTGSGTTTPAGSSPGTSSSSSSRLPQSGGDAPVGPLGLAAGMLLIAGASLVVMSRRRTARR